jgi:suppressor of ftsI
MSLSRRSFIQATGMALAAGSLPLRANASEAQPVLPVPPLIESRRGQPLFLTLQQSHWAFLGGSKAPVWGFNGMYLGPTVRVYNGDDVKLIYSNRLPVPAAMTISGLQVPGTLTGGTGRRLL